MSQEEENKLLIRTVGSTITKIVMFASISTVFVMGMHTCKVEKEVIEQCEDSCGAWRGMKEVTGTKCECVNRQQSSINNQAGWIIPRN